jgi:hypothetical protein
VKRAAKLHLAKKHSHAFLLIFVKSVLLLLQKKNTLLCK